MHIGMLGIVTTANDTWYSIVVTGIAL